MRVIVACIVVLMFSAVGLVSAQDTPTPTDSPTPTATSTATVTPTVTPEPYVYMTMQPEATDEPGQMTRFDYVVTAGETHIANLMTWLLYSVWGMFLFVVLVGIVIWRKK